MEYILHNTDIFDKEIHQKFKNIFVNNSEKYSKEKVYKLKVSFHLNLLEDPRFKEFNIPDEGDMLKQRDKDNTYNVMSYQLKQIKEVLSENNIEIYSTTIQGDNLDSENIIKIEVSEDNSEPTFVRKGKNKRRLSVNSVVPSLPFIQDKISELSSERLSRIYCDLLKIVKSKKLMSEILGIKPTKDDKKLFEAFDEQYGDLWLTTKEKERELLEQFKARVISVANKEREENKNNEGLIHKGDINKDNKR